MRSTRESRWDKNITCLSLPHHLSVLQFRDMRLNCSHASPHLTNTLAYNLEIIGYFLVDQMPNSHTSMDA